MVTARARATRIVVLLAIAIGLAAMANDFYVMHNATIRSLISSRDPRVRLSLATAGIWLAAGLGFALRAGAKYADRRPGQGASGLAALALITLAGTDVAKALAGASWTPWAIFWKVASGLVLATLLIRHLIARRSASGKSKSAISPRRPLWQ